MSSTSSSAGGEASAVADSSSEGDTKIVQYIVIREDLGKKLQWPVGSIVAQGAHAAIAACHVHSSLPTTQAYLEDVPHMTKVVYKIKNTSQLTTLAGQLKESDVPHYLWVEQPENEPTALATAPVLRTPETQALFKKCSLYK